MPQVTHSGPSSESVPLADSEDELERPITDAEIEELMNGHIGASPRATSSEHPLDNHPNSPRTDHSLASRRIFSHRQSRIYGL